MNGQQNNTTTYSAAEILRYLDGRMDRRELHALERAMLDDELLADSVEGYRIMRESMSDESILGMSRKVSVPQQKKDEKTVVVSQSAYRWVGYAAAACIVIAAGWWIFNISKPENTLPGGENDLTNPAFVNADPVDTISGDKKSTLADQTEVAAAETPKKETEPADNPLKKESVETPDLARATEKNSNPLPANTAVLPADAIADDRKMADAQDKSARKMAPATLSSEKPAYRFAITDSSEAIPRIGWSAYQEYLGQTLSLPAYNSPGTIEVMVATDGKVSGVTVAGAAEKEKSAINAAIKTGPAWKNKTGRPAKAIIRFQ